MTEPRPPRIARRLRRIRITGWTALSLLLTTIAGFATWAYSPYPVDDEAVREVLGRSDIIVTASAHLVVMGPAETVEHTPEEALLFIPGARVEPHAYASSFADFVAATGMTVVIPRPLANLALLDSRELSDFASLSPVPITAVAGHSLGGVKACQLASDPQIDNLILFASYCVNDLSSRDLQVLTILGSRDQLTDVASVKGATPLLPPRASTLTIDGANHASFADYGPQTGDGVATVSRVEVRTQLAQALGSLLGVGSGQGN